MNYTIISGILAGAAALTIALNSTASAAVKNYAGSDLMKKYAVVAKSDIDVSDSADVTAALSDFSSRLWTATATSENNVLSPLSAYIALAMAANGASGETLGAYSILGIDEGNTPQINAQIYRYIKSLTETSGSTKLSVANSVWVDDGFTANIDYLQLLADYFAASAFEDHLPTAVKKVNSWISDKTNGLITDMLDSIDESCLLMLINTLYMDAKWRTPFTKESTAKQTFTALDGTKTDTDFMHMTSNQRAILTDDYSGVVLPYNDGKLVFVALMANDDTLSTSEVIATLSGENAIENLARDAEYTRVRLSLPKFKLETSESLVAPLAKIGMGGIFAVNADYSKMGNGGSGFTVGDVLQNTYIRVDEEGTEAAAATVIMMKATASRPTSDPIVLTFDRPYVWAVIDETTGAVLFCGSYDYPV